MVEVNLAVLFITDLLALFGIYLIVNVSLNIEFGHTGIPNFGKVLAFAGGAFVVGSLPGRVAAEFFGINEKLRSSLGSVDYVKDNVLIIDAVNKYLETHPVEAIGIFLFTITVAAAAGAALGYLSAYPAMRLKEDYLAMTLLVFGEGIMVVGYNYPDLVGGTLGVSVPNPYRWVPGSTFVTASLVIMLVAMLFYAYSVLLSKSPYGRMLRSIRDNELAAMSLGKDPVIVRRNILVLSASMAAIGGALYAFYTGGVIATAYNRVSWTFWPWVMVIIGGAANNLGVLLGTAIFVVARKLIISYRGLLEPLVPFSVIWLDTLLLGITLLVVLLYRPEGLVRERPLFSLSRGVIENARNNVSSREN